MTKRRTTKAELRPEGEAPGVIDAVAVSAAPETAVAVVSPMTVLQRALTDGASMDVLERLLALQERWEAAQARKAFDAAMAALRADLPTILKTRTVDFTSTKGRTHYKHEDLALITEAISPAMAKVGLSFRWRLDNTRRPMITVTCIVAHSAGHSEETTLACMSDDSGNKNAIQADGSAITYLQRYTLKAAVGVAAGPDLDGVAPVVKAEKAPVQVAHAGLDATISQAARKKLWDTAKARGRTEQEVEKYFLLTLKVSRTADILARDFDRVMQAIEGSGPMVAEPGREPGQEG